MTGLAVGFIGLGNMGLPMALRLRSAGFDVLGYDKSPEAMARWLEAGGSAAQDIAAEGSRLDFLITMLPDGAMVRDAIVGNDRRLLSELRPECVLIDMSSSAPADTRALEGIVKSAGLSLLDAPVSGGVEAAADGTLTIMVGASSSAAFEAAHDLLKCLGGKIYHVGPVGAGHAAKALNNAVAATIFAATSEALNLGEHFGLTPKAMLNVLNAATGGSRISEHLFPNQVLNARFSQGFKLRLMAKDSAIAANMASESAYPAVILSAAAEQWRLADKQLPWADFTEMHRYLSASPQPGE